MTVMTRCQWKECRTKNTVQRDSFTCEDFDNPSKERQFCSRECRESYIASVRNMAELVAESGGNILLNTFPFLTPEKRQSIIYEVLSEYCQHCGHKGGFGCYCTRDD